MGRYHGIIKAEYHGLLEIQQIQVLILSDFERALKVDESARSINRAFGRDTIFKHMAQDGLASFRTREQ